MGDDVRRISHSELKDFQRCKRKWWLRHVRRLSPRLTGPAGPLQSGTRVHEALEAYYTPGSESDPLTVLEGTIHGAMEQYHRQCEEAGLSPDQVVVDKFKKDTETERAMVEGYLQWLADTGADSDLEVISAEQKVTVSGDVLGGEFVKPFDVVSKLDARVRQISTGKLLFVDHKTVQNFTQVLPLLRSDSQMLHYHLLEFYTHVDEVCDGALYNMLRKVKRTGKANPPFYMREHIPHNADEIEAYRFRLLGIIANVFELESRLALMPDMGPKLFAYPNPTRDCTWDCEFFQVCTLFDDGSRVEDALRELFAEKDPLERYQERTV